MCEKAYVCDFWNAGACKIDSDFRCPEPQGVRKKEEIKCTDAKLVKIPVVKGEVLIRESR